MLKRISLSLLYASLLLLAVAQDATAALKLKIQGPVTTLIVLDNSPQDNTPSLGTISFSGTIDNVPLVVATGISKPLVGSASLAELDFNVVSQSSAAGGTLTVSVTDTDYPAGAGPTTVKTQVGGTTHGSTSLQAYLDTANAEFGIAGPTVCTSGAMGPYTGAFTGEVTVPCILAGTPFSMTFVVVATLGPGQLQSFGGKILVPVPTLPIGCRFTGGGVDTNYNWDHTLESGKTIRNGAGHLPDPIDRYQFGGQVGARTAQQPLPSGEWEHHQQTGPAGSFSFHGGSHSADKGTWIADVRCSDAGYCAQARPAPCKQLDFDGVGTFSNVGKGANAPTFLIPNPNVITEPNGANDKAFTYHWFEVNIDDLGEPGKFNSGAPDSTICPGRGFGEKSAGLFVPDPVGNPGAAVLLPAAPLGNCDCPDFYRITVYKGVLNSEVTFLPNGKVNPASLNKVDVIYEVYGYGDGGNLQIHPPTGFDSK